MIGLLPYLSPYQFGVAIKGGTGKGGCKMVVHGVQIVLNIHFDWVFYRWMLQMPSTLFLGMLSSKRFVQ
jgi:hypothetical protein